MCRLTLSVMRSSWSRLLHLIALHPAGPLRTASWGLKAPCPAACCLNAPMCMPTPCSSTCGWPHTRRLLISMALWACLHVHPSFACHWQASCVHPATSLAGGRWLYTAQSVTIADPDLQYTLSLWQGLACWPVNDPSQASGTHGMSTGVHRAVKAAILTSGGGCSRRPHTWCPLWRSSPRTCAASRHPLQTRRASAHGASGACRDGPCGAATTSLVL